MSGQDFFRFLNTVLEYADIVDNSAILYAYLDEHEHPVMEDPLKKFN